MRAWHLNALVLIVCCAVFALWDYIQVLYGHIHTHFSPTVSGSGVEGAVTPLSVPLSVAPAVPSAVPQVALSMSPA